MQFSAILCLETYDWFCADRSHILVLKRVLQVIKPLEGDHMHIFLNKNTHAEFEPLTCFKAEIIVAPIASHLKLQIHFTKSANRDNIYKLCLWMPEEHNCLIITC